jgi:hypothetical protein
VEIPIALNLVSPTLLWIKLAKFYCQNCRENSTKNSTQFHVINKKELLLPQRSSSVCLFICSDLDYQVRKKLRNGTQSADSPLRRAAWPREADSQALCYVKKAQKISVPTNERCYIMSSLKLLRNVAYESMLIYVNPQKVYPSLALWERLSLKRYALSMKYTCSIGGL